MFRKRGYEATRIDDIVQTLENSQPTFFRYFPTKDAVLREVGERGYACICERLRSELSSKAVTGERVRRLYGTSAREGGARPELGREVGVWGASAHVGDSCRAGGAEAADSVLREILTR